MSELLYEVVSSTNYTESIANIFHRQSRSVVGWQSTQYAVTPIQVLFKLDKYSFVTEIYLHPKIYKGSKAIQIMISDDKCTFAQIATIYDFYDGTRIEISNKCRYLKINILEKSYGKAASIDFLRVYGHEYFKSTEKNVLYSQKKDKIDQILLENGFLKETGNQKWQVDDQTLTTLNDMTKIKEQHKVRGQTQELKYLMRDFQNVLKLGKRIKHLQHQLNYLNARQQYEKVKDIKDEILELSKKRDHFDQKYETSRFEDMILMGDMDNKQQQTLKSYLQQDRRQLEQEKRRRQQQAKNKQLQIDEEYKRLQNQEEEWWNKQNEALNIQLKEQVASSSNKSKKKKMPPKKQESDLSKSRYQFNNPYVYNQGDADMQQYIKPLINEFGASYLGDPEMLRRYQQLEYLDVLGARIWISTHSQNWRQRAAAVQAVLDFGQNKLPERYKDGSTKNLFLALMEFARINAEDKVLQIYYTSLKIVTIALAPPICGDDVPVSFINKSLQKMLPLLIQKISETNARAKQVSLKTLLSIFKHPAADINIIFHECLKICKQELNIKFIPVDKQNPRIIISRLEIISKVLTEYPKIEKKKIDYDDLLKSLMEGGLFHSHNDVRVMTVDVVEIIHKLHTAGTVAWFKSLNGLKPNISSQIENRLKIY